MNNEEIKEKIIPLIILAGVKRAGLFGSVARGDATRKSDIDLLVDLPKNVTLLGFIDLKLRLEEALDRPVDMVEYAALKPQMKEQILKDEVRIYDQGL